MTLSRAVVTRIFLKIKSDENSPIKGYFLLFFDTVTNKVLPLPRDRW